MTKILGSCSLCGGSVTVPLAWLGIYPPTPTCQKCGATPVEKPRVIQMARTRPPAWFCLPDGRRFSI